MPSRPIIARINWDSHHDRVRHMSLLKVGVKIFREVFSTLQWGTSFKTISVIPNGEWNRKVVWTPTVEMCITLSHRRMCEIWTTSVEISHFFVHNIYKMKHNLDLTFHYGNARNRSYRGLYEFSSDTKISIIFGMIWWHTLKKTSQNNNKHIIHTLKIRVLGIYFYV